MILRSISELLTSNNEYATFTEFVDHPNIWPGVLSVSSFPQDNTPYLPEVRQPLHFAKLEVGPVSDVAYKLRNLVASLHERL